MYRVGKCTVMHWMDAECWSTSLTLEVVMSAVELQTNFSEDYAEISQSTRRPLIRHYAKQVLTHSK